MKKVVHFPKQKENNFGSIRSKYLDIECNDCDNTDMFYGKAYTQPFIVIGKNGEHSYDVQEVGYKSGQVDEVIEACALCGSTDINIEVLSRDVK